MACCLQELASIRLEWCTQKGWILETRFMDNGVEGASIRGEVSESSRTHGMWNGAQI